MTLQVSFADNDGQLLGSKTWPIQSYDMSDLATRAQIMTSAGNKDRYVPVRAQV